MAIIIYKPDYQDPKNLKEKTQYYNYIEEIRRNVWNYLDEKELPETQINTLSRLVAAERFVLSRYGNAELTREEFLALPASTRAALTQAVIYQTALNILPTMPQIMKKQTDGNYIEYYEVSDRQTNLRQRIEESLGLLP